MTAPTEAVRIANRVAAETYATLEDKHSYPSLRLEEAINGVVGDAIRSAGIDPETLTSDNEASSVFGEYEQELGQIHQELAVFVYRATRAYLEAKAEPVSA